MTDRVAATVGASGFADGGRMEHFATTFVSYYTGALLRERPRPRCWQASWDVAGDHRLLIVQHLLLGINAHVNHDLALAVVAVADEQGDLASIRTDFDAVNDMLAAVYDEVIHDLDRVSRWTNKVAALGGGRIFNFSLRESRRQAWGAAERLYPLDTAGRHAMTTNLDELVSVLAYLVTRPPMAIRPVLRLARRLEEDDPQRVIAALLGSA